VVDADSACGCALLAVAAVAGGAGLYLHETRTGCFSYSNYERIRVGMSLEEVEWLLGGLGKKTVFARPVPAGYQEVVWYGPPHEGRHIQVVLRNGRAEKKDYFEPSL
jgi:hypothetical protein